MFQNVLQHRHNMFKNVLTHFQEKHLEPPAMRIKLHKNSNQLHPNTKFS